MNELLKRYGGRILFAPNDDKGGGNDSGNDGNGDGGDASGGNADDANGDGGSDGGSGKSGDADGKRSRLAGGLFAFRKNGDGGTNSGDDQDRDGDPPANDGRPEGLADKFWNAKDKTVNVDALSKAYSDLEKAHGDLKRAKAIGGEVPKDASEYFADGVPVPKEADRFTGLTTDDPGVKTWAEVCKTHGIGKDLATKLMSDMLVKMNDHAPMPIDPEAEVKALGKGGPSLIDGLFVWADGKADGGEFSEDDIDVVEDLMMTAKGARFLAKMRTMTGEQPIPIDPSGGSRGMSIEQLDEEYREAVKKKDYKRQQELDEMRTRINPEGNAPGISGRPGGYSI